MNYYVQLAVEFCPHVAKKKSNVALNSPIKLV